MLAILDTAVVHGLRGELVRVEVDITNGLPSFSIVGLPDAALSEARERVRGAIRNAGFAYPLSRITVNLAPADRRKHGAAYDVAMAIGILLANEQIRASGGPWALLGELSLDGSVRPVPGVLPMVATLRDAGHRRVCVPYANVAEAALVEAVEIVGAEGLDDVARLIAGPRGRTAARGQAASRPSASPEARPPRRVSRWHRTRSRSWPTCAARSRHAGPWRWPSRAGTTSCSSAHPGPARPCWLAPSPGCSPGLPRPEAREVAVIRSVSGLETSVG